MVNFLLSLVPLFIILAITKTALGWSIVLLPFSMILILLFSLGVSLLISTLAVFFPDVEQMYPVVLTGWMYMSPIIVPLEFLENVLNGWLLRLNPFYHVLNIFRIIMYKGGVPTGQDWAFALLVSFGALIIGWYIFTRKADSMTYYV